MKILMLAALVLAQDKKDETAQKLVTFKKGTAWCYEHVQGKEKRKAVVTANEASDTALDLQTKITADGKDEESHVSSLELKNGFVEWSGVVWTGRVGDFVHCLRLYKAGSKKDDTWDAAGKGEEQKWTATHKGVEEVKVPAGTYKDAIHVELKVKSADVTATLDLWLVPGVAMVKMKRSESEEFTAELKEFTPGK